MGGHGYDVLIKDALVFLFAAGVVVPVFRYLRLPTVVGFMLAGVVLGPYALGSLAHVQPLLEYVSVSDPEAAAPFAELGIMFLLFLLGLEFSFGKLWSMKRAVFGAGGLQAALSAAVIAGAVYWAGLPAEAAIICGLALALSSTAIVMQMLVEQKRAARPVGRAALSVLLFQDILVAPILIFIGFLSMGEGANVSSVLVEAAVNGLIAIAFIMLIGRFALRPMFRLAAQVGGRDFLMALTLLTVVGAATITATAGLSLALGAFLAGLLLGETEFKHQTEVDLEPFKGVLLGVFFMTVGMALDLPSLVTQPGVIFGGLAALLAVKFLIAFVACRLFAGDRLVSIETASLLAPAGEFAFVVVAAAGTAGVLDAGTSGRIAAIAGLSMLLIPVLGRLGGWAASWLEGDEPEAHLDEDFSDMKGHVIIAGFGRVGETVARILTVEDTEIVALERSAVRLVQARKGGWQVFLGDAARPEILHSAGADGARLFVVTVDDVAAAEAMVTSFHRLHPDVPIVVRARDHEHAARLRLAGATHVIPDAIESGMQMAGRALTEFGYDSETVRSRLAAERGEEYQRS
ncbi:glutathione-regulated potassium-efflux system protein [Hyphomonas johnsonii MHS-2]|uniref:Glutathione-regulated potassium-efflux system protein n=2 Tax=Hyphomonas johnsonii TaxID=81031 RepID=A0A059FJN9_9PROT|nr:glutathione-regulated potassium-efflux system protein [Hyphomonas johnsonii MHS-2]